MNGAILGLLVLAFIAGLGLLAAFVPVSHGFTPMDIAVIRTRPEQEAAGASPHGAASEAEELTPEPVLRPVGVINGR